MKIFAAVVILFGVVTAWKYFLARNALMAILAYMKLRKFPEPSDAEMKILCAEAWREMFRRKKDREERGRRRENIGKDDL